MNTLAQLRNRLPASTVLLIGSAVCAWLALFGGWALATGFPSNGLLISIPGDLVRLVVGLIFFVGSIFLFGWLVSPNWRGAMSAAGGCLASVLLPFTGIASALTVMDSLNTASALSGVIVGAVFAATTLLLSQTRSWRGMTGMMAGLLIGVMATYAAGTFSFFPRALSQHPSCGVVSA